jgi:hypothetical protein
VVCDRQVRLEVRSGDWVKNCALNRLTGCRYRANGAGVLVDTDPLPVAAAKTPGSPMWAALSWVRAQGVVQQSQELLPKNAEYDPSR